MQATIRPWVTTGIAIVGASVIAVTPISPPPTIYEPEVRVPSVQVPAVDLQASVLDILTFPAFRQYIVNQVLYYGTWAAGIAGAGVGLGQAIGALPGALVQLTQQLFSLDLQGALTTIEAYLVGSVAAVGLPLLDSIITNRERRLAIQLALQSAVPEAISGAGAAVLAAIDGVLRASIEGGQLVVDALLTFNLGNIVDALVTATGGFLGSFVEGGQDIVNGIVFAQQTIADALATPPPLTLETTSAPELSQRSVGSPPDLDVDTFTLSSKPEVDVVDSPDPGLPTNPGDSERLSSNLVDAGGVDLQNTVKTDDTDKKNELLAEFTTPPATLVDSPLAGNKPGAVETNQPTIAPTTTDTATTVTQDQANTEPTDESKNETATAS